MRAAIISLLAVKRLDIGASVNLFRRGNTEAV